MRPSVKLALAAIARSSATSSPVSTFAIVLNMRGLPLTPLGLGIEQAGELLDHGAAELLRIHDGHRTLIMASHVMADADRNQLDRRARLDPGDHLAQMPFEIGAAVHRKRR